MNVHSFPPKTLVARHNQLLRFRANGQPLERSQVPHPRRVLVFAARVGNLEPQLSILHLWRSLFAAAGTILHSAGSKGVEFLVGWSEEA